MYLYNYFTNNIVNYINTLSCPSKSNSKRIELTVHPPCYWGFRLTLCYSLWLLDAVPAEINKEDIKIV